MFQEGSWTKSSLPSFYFSIFFNQMSPYNDVTQSFGRRIVSQIKNGKMADGNEE